jgi:hypothetical protein
MEEIVRGNVSIGGDLLGSTIYLVVEIWLASLYL